jgi:hypothetical protein
MYVWVLFVCLFVFYLFCWRYFINITDNTHSTYNRINQIMEKNNNNQKAESHHQTRDERDLCSPKWSVTRAFIHKSVNSGECCVFCFLCGFFIMFFYVVLGFFCREGATLCSCLKCVKVSPRAFTVKQNRTFQDPLMCQEWYVYSCFFLRITWKAKAHFMLLYHPLFTSDCALFFF